MTPFLMADAADDNKKPPCSQGGGKGTSRLATTNPMVERCRVLLFIKSDHQITLNLGSFFMLRITLKSEHVSKA